MQCLSDQWSARQEGDSSSDSPHECPRTHLFTGCIRLSDEGETEVPVEDDDIPDLQTVLMTNDSEEDEYRDEAVKDESFWDFMFGDYVPFDESKYKEEEPCMDNKSLTERLSDTLTICQPFPGDDHGPPVDDMYIEVQPRFEIQPVAFELIQIYDRVQGLEAHIHTSQLEDPEFVVGRWYAEQCAFSHDMEHPWQVARQWADTQPHSDLCMTNTFSESENYDLEPAPLDDMELGGSKWIVPNICRSNEMLLK